MSVAQLIGVDQLWRSSTPNCVHRSLRLHETGRIDFVPFPLLPDIFPHQRLNRFRGRVITQHRLDIDLVQSEEAIAQPSVGGETDAIATDAEWPGDRRND